VALGQAGTEGPAKVTLDDLVPAEVPALLRSRIIGMPRALSRLVLHRSEAGAGIDEADQLERLAMLVGAGLAARAICLLVDRHEVGGFIEEVGPAVRQFAALQARPEADDALAPPGERAARIRARGRQLLATWSDHHGCSQFAPWQALAAEHRGAMAWRPWHDDLVAAAVQGVAT
jgi:hypothetical protein